MVLCELDVCLAGSTCFHLRKNRPFKHGGDQTDLNDEFKSVMALKGWCLLSARQVKDQTNLSFSTKKDARIRNLL